MQKLGIIAGQGQFPCLIAQNARKQGYKVYGLGFIGQTEKHFLSLTDQFTWVRLGQLGKTIRFFKKNRVTELIFAGAINKPKALEIRPDLRATKLLFRLKSLNDDAIFKGIIAELNKEGFKVIGPERFVPELLAPAGALTRRLPSARELQDFSFGWPILKQIGALDIGQCIVVKEKMVIAVESIEGTNATIERAGKLGGPGCVVLKGLKPTQDTRVDLPSLGLQTIQTMLKAKASALFFEAERTIFFDLDQSLQLANTHSLSIIGIKDGRYEP